MLDVLRLAELAGPFAVGKLPGGVRVEETETGEGYFLEARFERAVGAHCITKGQKRFL